MPNRGNTNKVGGGFRSTTDFQPDTLLGKVTLEEMQKRGWSQQQLSRRAGISQPSLRDILLGVTKSPRMDVVVSLAQAFGLPVSELLGFDEGSAKSDGVTPSQLTAQAGLILADEVETLRAMVRHNDRRLSALEGLMRQLSALGPRGHMDEAAWNKRSDAYIQALGQLDKLGERGPSGQKKKKGSK